MLEKNMSVNGRPMLVLDKEIVSKADVHTIENMRSSGKGRGFIDSGIPTTPTTFNTVPTTFTTLTTGGH